MNIKYESNEYKLTSLHKPLYLKKLFTLNELQEDITVKLDITIL